MAEKKNETKFGGTGRRKTSVARVNLMPGSGKITVNGRAFEDYFPVENHRTLASRPLSATRSQPAPTTSSMRW